MKTVTLDIVKKNRVYFKCLNERGYEVKLKITSQSENLPLGKQELLVKDCSVRTKYGTDIIYDLEDIVKNDSIVTLKHDKYNRLLVEQCKNLGGRWDAEEKAWVFSAIVADKVEELDYLINTDIVNIEITAKEDRWGEKGAVHFCGYRIAIAQSRDSGATLCDGVAMITGAIKSGGSMKNWGTEVSAGSQFRLRCSRKWLVRYNDSERWDYAVISDLN